LKLSLYCIVIFDQKALKHGIAVAFFLICDCSVPRLSRGLATHVPDYKTLLCTSEFAAHTSANRVRQQYGLKRRSSLPRSSKSSRFMASY
jgi:hypothetical protein